MTGAGLLIDERVSKGWLLTPDLLGLQARKVGKRRRVARRALHCSHLGLTRAAHHLRIG
jgi:hypothetical protein